MGSWIRSTPAYDGDGLFVAGMPDILVCLDPNTGAERWRADFHRRYETPLPELGFVCSPLCPSEERSLRVRRFAKRKNQLDLEPYFWQILQYGLLLGSHPGAIGATLVVAFHAALFRHESRALYPMVIPPELRGMETFRMKQRVSRRLFRPTSTTQ
jgi:hypothetical protein